MKRRGHKTRQTRRKRQNRFFARWHHPSRLWGDQQGRVGNAGIWASLVVALVGVLIGALATYVGERGAAAQAARTALLTGTNRVISQEEIAFQKRERIVNMLLAGTPLERFPTPLKTFNPTRPKIIIIVDDMGLDHAAFGDVLALPGPLTLSFLPYAKNVNDLALRAREHGDEIMLHLPMQPQGVQDPGPHALKTGMTGARFIKELEWNLSQFEGYVGVNNHMGSRLTTDEAAMKTVLAYIKHRDLFFLDSVTTGDTVVRSAGAMVGAQIFSRDVFLDADVGSAKAVVTQLALLEKIAKETGYAIAICHPYQTTLATLGPWLTTAPFRGFDIVTVSALSDLPNDIESLIMAQAPDLRL